MTESLTDKRRQVKKILVAGIYVLLWAIFLGALYALFGPAPASCFDNKKNGTETGVDCGGSCKACLVDKLKNVEIKEVKFLPSGQGRVDLVGLVYNPNPSIGVKDLQYKFSIYDGSGNVLRVIDENTHGDDIIFTDSIYVWPQTIRPIIVPNVSVNAAVARVALDVKVAQGGWALTPVVAPPQLFVRPAPGFQIGKSSTAFATYNGLVSNGSNVEFELVNVDVVARNKSGQIVAVNRHVVRSLVPGQDRIAEMAWFSPNQAIVGLKNEDFSLTVSTDIYLPGNVVQKAGALQDFQKH